MNNPYPRRSLWELPRVGEHNRAIYWGLPLAVYIFPYIANFFGVGAGFLQGEHGLVELGTVLFLFFALLYALTSFQSARTRLNTHPLQNLLTAWLVIIVLGIVYFAGEELSWGQHLAGWQTPDEWSLMNDQRETNLHNTHAIFDQVPRLLLTLAMLVGGLFIPLYLRWRQISLSPSSLFYWILPAWMCLPTALCLLPLKLIASLVEHNHLPSWFEVSSGEVKEMLIALFIMMYVIALRERVLRYQMEGT